MALPPAWKVKRELWRVYDKAKTAASLRSLDRWRQSYHDRNLSRLLRETPGARPLTQRVAAFILFQPKGIAGSTFLTLDHLAQEGWSVLVISNAPLSDADRARLAAASGHVIERPNTGYDFGAYREAWNWLHRNGHALDRLILMNDSAWFPLRRNDDSLRRMEAMKVDLAGQIFKEEKSEARGRNHLESHLLMFSGHALQHPAVIRFWADYVMTDNKPQTIQRGERGLTQLGLASGLLVQGLLDREKMVDLLSQLPDPKLLQALESLAIHNEGDKLLRAGWLAAAKDNRPWRNEFLTWTSRQLSNSRQYFVSAAFIDPAASLGGLGFLKKSNDRRFQLARLAIIRGIDAGRIAPMDPLIEEEVKAVIRNWQPPFDWRAKPGDVQTADL